MIDHDALTGLYTRQAFFRHATNVVTSNPDIKYDVVISDFVNFKHFNARFGADAGDLLLIKTAELLQTTPAEIPCGRYGADRFISLVKHLDDSGIAYLDDFQLLEEAKDILPSISITVKFGIATIEDPNVPIAVYCDRAYSAVQSIKHQFGKRVGIYDKYLDETLQQESLIEETMKHSLENNEFEVYYQPKMDLTTNTLCGAEALVRWIHPTLGFMNPGIFIPIFEKNGFITSMDLYVWEKVCKDMVEWREKGLPIIPISANASRRDFLDQDLAQKLFDIINKYSLDYSQFHLEVTESCFADEDSGMLEQINAIHNAGISIELDDFGSGYTSLSSLNNMDIDILKLDMSLLRKEYVGSKRSVLTFAMQLAKMMNIKTIQEGVETTDELDKLRDLGCNYIQGYHYSKPLNKEDFEEFLRVHQ